MRSLKFLILCLLAFACGGVDEGYDSPDGGDELGSVEQAMTVTGPLFGASTAASHLACSVSGPAGQTCTVPRALSMPYCYSSNGTGAFTAAEISRLDAALSHVTTQLANKFSFPKVNITQGSCILSANIPIIVKKGATGGSSSSTDVDAYVGLQTQLVNGPVTSNRPGTWNSAGGGIITVDYADAAAQSATNQGCIIDHGFRHAFMALAGQGATTSADQFGSLMTTRNINPTFFDFGAAGGKQCVHATASNQQKCVNGSFNPASPGVLNFNPATCPQ